MPSRVEIDRSRHSIKTRSQQARRIKVSQRTTKPYYRRTTCRICKSPNLRVFLDFGSVPPANSFHPPADSAGQTQLYPLSCAYCRRCGLVQVPDVVDPNILFKRYNYFSSASAPMVEHFRQQAAIIQKLYTKDPRSLICEIGSNDGVFLQNFVGKCRVIGVDPADNINSAAALKGITTVNGYFDASTASTLRRLFGPAKIIFSANCFAHMDDVHAIMDGVLKLLSDDGVFVFENHRFVDLLRTLCFDQIYHEHLCYYTLRPIEYLMKRFGMRVIDVRLIPIQGQSFQVHCARIGSGYNEQSRVQQIREEEDALGLDKPATYKNFALAVTRHRENLKALLRDLKSQGKRIVGYGAPAKATLLLNTMGIDCETIDYAVDTTPIKQGRVIPGTNILIKPPDALKSDTPDYVLLLAWNYADAILKKEARLRKRGIKFILPLTNPRIL